MGILSAPEDEPLIREVFELFKTPWEWYEPDCGYDVVIAFGDFPVSASEAKLLIVYSARKTTFDAEEQIEVGHKVSPLYRGFRLPILGDCATFSEQGTAILADEKSGKRIGYMNRSGPQILARIGYDLCREVGLVLSGEHPDAWSVPAVDLHIDILRNLILSCGCPLVEIPPAPSGYPFVVCLTHDVDHPLLRKHRLDHTALGFLYRAVVGSTSDYIRNRIPFSKLWTNWCAAAKLPLVYAGLVEDLWSKFDAYVDVDRHHPSTFFVIPFADRPGITRDGLAPPRRAARYDITDIAPQIQALTSAGCEVGLHGIDAWIDPGRGREEHAGYQEPVASGCACTGFTLMRTRSARSMKLDFSTTRPLATTAQ